MHDGFKLLLKIAWSSRGQKSLVEGITNFFASDFPSPPHTTKTLFCQTASAPVPGARTCTFNRLEAAQHNTLPAIQQTACLVRKNICNNH